MTTKEGKVAEEKNSMTNKNRFDSDDDEIPEDLIQFLDKSRNNAEVTLFHIEQLLIMLDAAGLDPDAAKEISLTYVASILSVFLKKTQRYLTQIERITYKLKRREGITEPLPPASGNLKAAGKDA